MEIALALLLQASAALPPVAVEAQRQVLRSCGIDEARLADDPHGAWAAEPSSWDAHLKLRTALGEPMPVSGTAVLIHGIGGDLSTTEDSVIAERGRYGLWRGTAVGRSKSWAPGAVEEVFPPRRWTLTAAAGRRLDAILADRCLYAEPTSFSTAQGPGVGQMYVQVETITPARRHVEGSFSGLARGLSAELISLLTPPDAAG